MGGGEWSAQRGDPVLKVLIYCVPLLSSKENHTFFLKKKKKKEYSALTLHLEHLHEAF